MNIDPKKMTILVVDDVPQNISILGEYLSAYTLKVATSGVKAIEIAESTELDLILLDIIMPDIDGYELCRRFKEKPATREVPVIFLSVMSEVTDKVRGFKLGAVDYITKPFQVEEVKSRIETHLTLSAYRKILKNLNYELEKKVEERTRELLYAKNKAEESSRLKTHFLSLMSHELRTPLAGIMGFSEILMEELPNDGLKDYATALNQSATRLKVTLESILNLSKFQAGKQVVNLSPINLNQRIQSRLGPHRINAELKKVKLFFTEPRDIVLTAVDKVMLDVILNNLVSNAIKYTSKGKVEVSLNITRVDNIMYDCLTVADTGIGIPKEKQNIIFEEFRQADEGMGRAFEGLGIGLSLVSKFVDLHGGKIELESTPQAGSTFKVYLPHVTHLQLDEEIPGIISQEGRKLRTGIKSRLLIVEGNQHSMQLQKYYLEDLCDVDFARDGFEAMDVAKTHRYRVILVNVLIYQGLSMIELTREIRKLKGYNTVPVIAYYPITAEQRVKFTPPAMDGNYHAKPNTKRELIELLSEYL